MKRIIHGIGGLVRWGPRSLRRAVMSRFDARVVRLVAGAVEARVLPSITESLSHSDERLKRIEALVANADRSAFRLAEEVDLVLGGLTREVFRLQAKVEMLRAGLEDRAEDASKVGGLSILTESSQETPGRRASLPPERSRVG